MDLYIGERLYHNFAVGSFHTKKLCSKLYSIEIELHKKTKKNIGTQFNVAREISLRGNACTYAGTGLAPL